MNTKTILSTSLTLLLLNSINVQANIIDKLAESYKNKNINYIEYFNIKKQPNYINKLNINIKKNEPIVIIYDNIYTKDKHGEHLLNIIDNKKNSNIFIFDYYTKQIYDTKLKPLAKNINFENFLYNLSNSFYNQKIIVNISNGTSFQNENDYKKNIKYIYEDNLNFISLINHLSNVYVNKSFSNLQTFSIKEEMIKILNNPKIEMYLLSKLDNKLDNIIYNKNLSLEDKNKKIKYYFGKIFKEFKLEKPKEYEIFMNKYINYKEKVKYEAIDCFSYLAAIKNFNNNLKNRIKVIQSISPSLFIYNYENINKKLPKDIISLYELLKENKKINIDTEKGKNIIYIFDNIMKKYKHKIPELYVGNYDYGLSREKTNQFYTGLNSFYIYGDIQKGNSYTTALKTFIDLNPFETKFEKEKKINNDFKNKILKSLEEKDIN